MRPADFDVPEELRPLLERQHAYNPDRQPVLVRVDLDDDGQWEYAFLVHHNGGYLTGVLYAAEKSGWATHSLHLLSGQWGEDMLSTVHAGEIGTTAPRFKNLVIGDLVLDVR